MDDNQLKLTRDQRRRLIEILNKLIVTATAGGRSLLLRDLPPTLQSLLPQGEVQRVQIETMVRAVEDWGGAVDGTPTLLVLIENALDLSEGSGPGDELKALQQEILQPHPATPAPDGAPPGAGAGAVPASGAPAAAALSPLDRAVRYRDLRDAADRADWAQVQALAVGLEGYRDVPELLGRASTAQDGQRRQQEVAAEAYAAGEWDQFILLARQLTSGAPPILSSLLARAWRELALPVQRRQGPGGVTVALAPTPTGCRVLSAAPDGTLTLWDLYTNQRRAFPALPGKILALALVRGAPQALRVLDDGTAQWLDLTSPQAPRTLTGQPAAPTCAAVQAGANRVVAGTGGGDLVLWQLDQAVALSTIPAVAPGPLTGMAPGGTPGAIPPGAQAVALTPDGKQALVATADGPLVLWNLDPSGPARTLPTVAGRMTALAITANGRFALSGSATGTLVLWDLLAAQVLRTWTGTASGAPATALAVSDDGRIIVAFGAEPGVAIWRFPPGLLT